MNATPSLEPTEPPLGDVSGSPIDAPTPDRTVPDMKRHRSTPLPASHPNPRLAARPNRYLRWAGPGEPAGAAPSRQPKRNRPPAGTLSSTSPRPTRRQRIAAAIVLVVVVVAGLMLALSQRTEPAPRTSTTTPRILAPKDAALLVGGHKVEQMAGSCDAQSCFHVPPAKPVVIHAGTSAHLPVTAGQSTLFTVGAYNLDRHNQPVPVSVQPRPVKATAGTVGATKAGAAGNDLVLDHVRPGRYQVTVSGQPNGGMWQFTLVVK